MYRLSNLCKFLRTDIHKINELATKANITDNKFEKNTKLTEKQVILILSEYGKSLIDLFILFNNRSYKRKKTNSKNKLVKFSINDLDYPLKPENNLFQNEFRLLNSILYLIKNNMSEHIKDSLLDFDKQYKYSHTVEFKNLSKYLEKNQDLNTEEIALKFKSLLDIIESDDYALDYNKCEEEEAENEERNLDIDYDEEKDIMNSFRYGNQDKFGY